MTHLSKFIINSSRRETFINVEVSDQIIHSQSLLAHLHDMLAAHTDRCKHRTVPSCNGRPHLVPVEGVEPSPLSRAVFETAASAVPPRWPVLFFDNLRSLLFQSLSAVVFVAPWDADAIVPEFTAVETRHWDYLTRSHLASGQYHTTIRWSRTLERGTGNDPVSQGWKPRAQPLDQPRINAFTFYTSSPAGLDSGNLEELYIIGY